MATSKTIECGSCGNTLGEWVAGYLLVRHRKREMLCIPLSITCGCGDTWRPPEDLRGRAARSVADAEDVLSAAV